LEGRGTRSHGEERDRAGRVVLRGKRLNPIATTLIGQLDPATILRNTFEERRAENLVEPRNRLIAVQAGQERVLVLSPIWLME